MTLRAKAIDPTQYDKVGDDWINEGGEDRPWRIFFKDVLAQELGDLTGSSVLDVGCGCGWLSDLVFKLKATNYVGIDPSVHNIQWAKEHYPKAKFINISFENYRTKDKFDLVLFVMSSEHINKLDEAFEKLSQMLSMSGQIVLITGNYEAYTRPRFDYKLEVEGVFGNEVAVFTHRPHSVDTVDIIRKPEAFKLSGQKFGFKMTNRPLTIPKKIIEMIPKYAQYKDVPMYNLLTFRR